jgi:hypothetical protein
VLASRFLQDAKGKDNPQPPESLSEPVRNLLNYPDIIDVMNQDLTWTQQLGEAVYANQQEVMAAVQRFRLKAYAAGNLKTDDKQTIDVVEQDIIIVPAKPDVIYVPQYVPSTVVVYSSVPVYRYYPTAYPVYYYPYPPGYAFTTAFFWGATMAWAFNWHNSSIGWGYHGWHGHGHNNININRNVNIDRNTNINANRPGTGAPGTWRPQSGNVANRPGYTRPGDAGFRPNIDRTRPVTGPVQRPINGSANTRPHPGPGNRPVAGGGAATLPSTGAGANRPSGGRVTQQPSPGIAASRPVAAGSRTPARPSTGAGSGYTRPVTRPSHSATQRPSTVQTSSRSTSPRANSYGGMSGRQATAASYRGSASRSASAGGGRRR